MPARRRTIYSRVEAPLGTIRERDAGNGQLVRMIKIRMDGKTGLRWIPYAKWWWQQHRGPVPEGKRICHSDGNLLNDSPENLVALTSGEVFKLYHQLDPEMSRRNRAACGRSAAARNVEMARARRAVQWLPCRWYGVDFQSRTIFNQPRRSRWMVYHDHGFLDRLADHLKSKIAAARDGSTNAAEYVLQQAIRLETYWRWVRSSSLGWPSINCMDACILAALADAGRPLCTTELISVVTEMRRSFDWRPHALVRSHLTNRASALRDWIVTVHHGRGDCHWMIGPKALEARLSLPRIVPVRGRDLGRPMFADFAGQLVKGEAA